VVRTRRERHRYLRERESDSLHLARDRGSHMCTQKRHSTVQEQDFPGTRSRIYR